MNRLINYCAIEKEINQIKDVDTVDDALVMLALHYFSDT